MQKYNKKTIAIVFASVLFWNLVGVAVIWVQNIYWGYQPVTQVLSYSVFGYVFAHRATKRLMQKLNLKLKEDHHG